jgi:hypothetical protein
MGIPWSQAGDAHQDVLNELVASPQTVGAAEIDATALMRIAPRTFSGIEFARQRAKPLATPSSAMDAICRRQRGNQLLSAS